MIRLKLLIIAILLVPSVCFAEYQKTFNEGPYIRIIGGAVSSDFDNNARTGQKTADNYEGAYGFQFGWFVTDSLGTELEVRYATKKIRDNREHIFNVNLNAKYCFITNALTGIMNKQFQILPFVQGGPAVLLAAVPGDPLSNDKIMGVYGGGLGGGAGIDFLIKRYIYFGVQFQADAVYIPSVQQTVNGSRATIIAGGWNPILGFIGTVGVHF